MYLTYKVEHEESKHFYAKSHLDNWLWIFAQCSLWKKKKTEMSEVYMT